MTLREFLSAHDIRPNELLDAAVGEGHPVSGVRIKAELDDSCIDLEVHIAPHQVKHRRSQKPSNPAEF